MFSRQGGGCKGRRSSSDSDSRFALCAFVPGERGGREARCKDFVQCIVIPDRVIDDYNAIKQNYLSLGSWVNTKSGEA